MRVVSNRKTRWGSKSVLRMWFRLLVVGKKLKLLWNSRLVLFSNSNSSSSNCKEGILIRLLIGNWVIMEDLSKIYLWLANSSINNNKEDGINQWASAVTNLMSKGWQAQAWSSKQANPNKTVSNPVAWAKSPITNPRNSTATCDDAEYCFITLI